MSTILKENIWLGLAYNFKGLVYYHPGMSMVGCRPESAIQVLAGSKKRKEATGPLKPQNPPLGTHFFQQDHTYFHKATPPNPSQIVPPHDDN